MCEPEIRSTVSRRGGGRVYDDTVRHVLLQSLPGRVFVADEVWTVLKSVEGGRTRLEVVGIPRL